MRFGKSTGLIISKLKVKADQVKDQSAVAAVTTKWILAESSWSSSENSKEVLHFFADDHTRPAKNRWINQLTYLLWNKPTRIDDQQD